MTRNGTGLPYRRPRANTLSAWIWNSVLFDTGPIGNIPFGLSNPSRVPCPPATSRTASSPRARASCPSRAATGSMASAASIGTGASRSPDGTAVDLVAAGVQPGEFVQIDRSELLDQGLAAVGGQGVPVGQDVVLAVLFELA